MIVLDKDAKAERDAYPVAKGVAAARSDEDLGEELFMGSSLTWEEAREKAKRANRPRALAAAQRALRNKMGG